MTDTTAPTSDRAHELVWHIYDRFGLVCAPEQARDLPGLGPVIELNDIRLRLTTTSKALIGSLVCRCVRHTGEGHRDGITVCSAAREITGEPSVYELYADADRAGWLCPGCRQGGCPTLRRLVGVELEAHRARNGGAA